MVNVDLRLGDCLEVMATLAAGSIDAIITDLPYGTTACKWDEIIPFAPMWEQVKRVLKPRGAFVTTASQPFTSALIASNREWFKYAWVWDKKLAAGFQIAKYRPMMRHEDICVFGRGAINYYPIMTERDKPRKVGGYGAGMSATSPLANPDGQVRISTHTYPVSIIQISNANRTDSVHPTQKPVALYEYLIRTYTNEGDTVGDFTCGSGTTAVAAVNTNRNFVGCDNDPGYFDLARRRIAEVQNALMETARL